MRKKILIETFFQDLEGEYRRAHQSNELSGGRERLMILADTITALSLPLFEMGIYINPSLAGVIRTNIELIAAERDSSSVTSEKALLLQLLFTQTLNLAQSGRISCENCLKGENVQGVGEKK